ncbi:MAG TPA: 50S ribosomal protein L29 [Oligoflexia bacterium]|nr:50S ribosomal protein L29 [Oligoflexia bacterium]HMP49197.1 50S ribosomal protein L29 [Oligoflexia bacterium]
MKTKNELAELRLKDDKQLKEELAQVEKEMLNLRFRKAVNQIPDPSLVTKLRKKVARVQTVLREKAAALQ